MKIWIAALAIATVGIGSGRAQTVGTGAGDTAAHVSSGGAAAVDPALQGVLVAVSEAMWRAMQQQDMSGLTKVVMPDLLFVMRPGVLSLNDLPTSGCELSSYRISDPQVRQVTPYSATLVYKLHQDLRCGEPAEPANQFATDNFVKVDGTWKVAVHTQTPRAD